uniref:Uncharacterized protein n=2 Tax=Strongyloides stercoralis TaxID=6248 RepID=A0AAF5I0A0_STRER
MNFLKNLSNKLPSIKSNKNKKKLTQKDFSTFTKTMYEERKRRKKRYQEEERKKIKQEKQLRSKKRSKQDKVAIKRYVPPNNIDSKEGLLPSTGNPPNPLLQLCKEKVLETKVDNGNLNNGSENDTSGIGRGNGGSLREKKYYISSNDKILSQYCSLPLAKSSNASVMVHEANRNNKLSTYNGKCIKKSLKELQKEKSLKLGLKFQPGDICRKKKNFDSIGSINTAPTCKTIDIIHPYAILNIKQNVLNSKLPYLYKENNNNNWSIYDATGVPFWAPKLENDDDNTDDTTPDSIPLDSASLIDIEQGKLELPECIEEPQDLNPFQPLRVLINRNPKYFENKLLCLITLRSMAALHLKDMPSKTEESVLKSIKASSVEITDIRECVSYSKWVPKTTFKCNYTGEVWPTKLSNSDEKN